MYRLSSICFMCLNNKNLQKVLQDNGENDTVLQVTFVLPEISIFLELSKTPAHICSTCKTKLQSYYTFKKMCLESLNHLKQDIEMLQGSNETQDNSVLEIRINNEILIKEEPNMDIDTKDDAEGNGPFLPSGEEEEKRKNSNIKDSTDIEKQQHSQYVKCEVLDAVQEENSNFPSTSEGEAEMNTDETSLSAFTSTISICNIDSLKKSVEDKKTVCTVCNKKYSSIPILKRHMLIHRGMFNYECTECDRKFVRSNQLKNHMKFHTDTRDFECTLCDKKYLNRARLKYHLKGHLGIKEHKCSFCKKKFVVAAKLKTHIQRMHSDNKD